MMSINLYLSYIQNLIFIFSPLVEKSTPHTPPLFVFINRTTLLVKMNTDNKIIESINPYLSYIQNLIFIFSPLVENITSHTPPLFVFINRTTLLVKMNTDNKIIESINPYLSYIQNLIFIFSPLVEKSTPHTPTLIRFY